MAKAKYILSSAIIATCVAAAPAFAANMNLEIDQAKSVRLKNSATGIVVGNAGIADVIVHEPKVLLFIGKSVGTTSVLVVGANGRTVYSGTIKVSEGSKSAGLVTFQRGDTVSTSLCEDRCINVGSPEASPDEANKAYNAARARSGFTSGK